MSTATEVKHTPGPWASNGNGLILDTSDRGVDARIAYLYAEFADRSVEERNANASLIAAAPELLEALELLHRIALQTPQMNNPDDREVIDAAWAAIRKAKGEL